VAKVPNAVEKLPKNVNPTQE